MLRENKTLDYQLNQNQVDVYLENNLIGSYAINDFPIKYFFEALL